MAGAISLAQYPYIYIYTHIERELVRDEGSLGFPYSILSVTLCCPGIVHPSKQDSRMDPTNCKTTNSHCAQGRKLGLAGSWSKTRRRCSRARAAKQSPNSLARPCSPERGAARWHDRLLEKARDGVPARDKIARKVSLPPSK